MFIGGATVGLWRTDPAAHQPRVTLDVDVVVEVASLGEYSRFQDELRARDFHEDVDAAIMCRWRGPGGVVVLDAIPADARLAGLADAHGWLGEVVRRDTKYRLPSGVSIRVTPPEWLLVLKLEAFADRGHDDVLASPDFEDIVLLVDGREELVAELGQLPDRARRYVSDELGRVMRLPSFEYGVEGALPGVDARARAIAVTVPRLHDISVRR